MTKVYFYNCIDAPNKLKKTYNYLLTKEVKILAGVDILEPKFTVSNIDVVQVNYCYIEKFKRYYSCQFSTLENGVFLCSCSVDVWSSFRDNISALKCLVSRQEFKYNDMIVDNEIITRVGTITEKKYIGNIGKTISYVLTVTGGSE